MTDRNSEDGYALGSQYAGMKLDELREEAAKRKIKWSGVRKADLVELIKGWDRNQEREELLASSVPQKEAVAPEKKPPSVPHKIEWFEVTKTSRFCVGGVVTRLREGAKVSSQTHDMVAIRQQKVPLESCSPPSLRRDAYGEPIYPNGKQIILPPDSGKNEKTRTMKNSFRGHELGLRVVPDPSPDNPSGTLLEHSDESAAYEEAKSFPKPPMGGDVE